MIRKKDQKWEQTTKCNLKKTGQFPLFPRLYLTQKMDSI